MKFGPVSVSDAEGAVLAHSEPSAGLKKGRVLSAVDLSALRAAGLEKVTVARLEAGDIAEDEAARRVARTLAGRSTRMSEAFTGRVNLYATATGVLRVDTKLIDAINCIDESVTVATLPDFEPVRAGSMLATVKIIPYAAPDWALAKAEEIAGDAVGVDVRGFAAKSIELISTETPGFKHSLVEKNRQVTEDRVTSLGARLSQHRICSHTLDGVREALTAATGDIVLIFGATANSDRHDVIPAAIVAAGGQVLHCGMPVDPGNLLVLGELRGAPVIGLPGCARSPKRNGFDFVLERLCADIPVKARDIMAMGAGGLLKEIPVRGQPREPARATPNAPHRIAAIVLAAGRSTRMGENKLLAPIAGQAVLTHTLSAAQAANLHWVTVVTGHERARLLPLLPSGIREAFNPGFASGMASSLKVGIAMLPDDADAALVMLGDMPAVRPSDIARLIAAFDPTEGRGIVVPTHQGKRGHPVLFGRAYWPAIMAAEGDHGARQALIDNADAVCEVPVNHPGVMLDADTPDALDALRKLMDT